jgi:hypothetical protein
MDIDFYGGNYFPYPGRTDLHAMIIPVFHRGAGHVELLPRTPNRMQPDPEPVAGFMFAECDRLMGDESDRAVTWNGNSDISSIGESVSMRVKMFQAKLFAY